MCSVGQQQAVKIFDRAELMRRGARFARPRARGLDGALVPVDAGASPENYLKVKCDRTKHGRLSKSGGSRFSGTLAIMQKLS